MGQTFSLAALSAGSASIDVPELSDLMYEKSLSTARFMKCIRARHQHGVVVVKLVMKPFPQLDLETYVKAIRSERDALVDVPNALGYQRVFETNTNGYLVRQYLYSSLYDRMSTRPFLEDIEKKWLAYQLLCAVRDSHAHNVYHGDIKSENTLVTSWNWLYLADYSSSFKKTYLPEDNPADFSYYFDNSGRRTCYLAPERFLAAGERDDGRGITWAMDIFSAGCVIAELFLEAPIFSLSQLYKYRKGEYDPEYGYLSRIQDQDVREMVSHMIQLEPESRYSAEEYLNFWRRKAFPEYFYSFLHQYMGMITDSSSGRSPILPQTESFGDADERIDRLYYDFDKISYFLGYETEQEREFSKDQDQTTLDDVIPVQIDLPNNRHQASSIGRRTVDDGSLIFLALVVSSIRNTARSSARVKACDLMLAFAERVTDEAKLDRVLPYVVAMLNEKSNEKSVESDVVKVAAIRTMTQILSLITVVSPANAYAFTEYIRPVLQQFVIGPKLTASPLVRATYASCLSSLAQSSMKILDMVQALRADGSIPTGDPEAEDGVNSNLKYGTSFDKEKLDLFQHFEAHTIALLTDSNAYVRRAFLRSVSGLCVFFGSSRASDVILTHLNTYLNDKDWILKCAFFQTIVGVATFVGGASLEEYILPLMTQALADPEEFIVEKVLSSFASMAELGLFQRSKTWEMVDLVVPFVIHPNIWIREAAAHFISASSQYLSVADLQCIIAPLLQPYLKNAIFDFTEVSLLDALKKPLPRPVLEMAVIWATKVQTGGFWQPVQHQGQLSLGMTEAALSIASGKDRKASSLTPLTKNEEDEQWMKRLRNIGMTSDDEYKLVSLKEYIRRVSSKPAKDSGDRNPTTLNGVIPLKNIDVTPQTIFFESPRTKSRSRRASSGGQRQRIAKKSQAATSTIADALLDASSTIEGPLAQGKLSYARAWKERQISDYVAQPSDGGSRPTSVKMTSPLSTSPGGRQCLSKTKPDVGSRGLSDIDKAQSEGTLTPANSIKSGTGPGTTGGVRHRSSAITLLNKRDIPKTIAETGTSSANVMGKMDGPALHETKLSEESSSAHHPQESPLQAGHTYEGNDPNVMKLLDSLAIENYPLDTLDFGPTVVPAVSKRHSRRKEDPQAKENPWRPERVLIATFGEHEGPINRVVASPDHTFFITGSDDGTTKIWDTSRLERNLAHRSRQTLSHAEGAKVKSLCFVKNTHTFVSAADDGSIKVVKVSVSVVNDNAKYGKLRVMREYKLREEYAVWLDHSKLDVHSVLFIATNTSKIIALDLRNMNELYTLANPVHHGIPTCFCADPKRGWLLVGTSRGLLDLWDLRFHLLIKSWGLAGATPIYRVLKHPFRTRGKKVCVVGGTGQTDITIWDLEKSECCEVFRANVSKGGGGKDSLKPYEAWGLDEENPEGMLRRFATAIDPARNGWSDTDHGIRALAIGVDSPDDNWDGKYGYFVTGGADKKLRFWDQVRVEASMVISGLEPEEDQPKFTTSHPTPGLTLHTERASQQAPSAPNAGAGSRGAAASNKKTGSKLPRNTVISLQQQSLLRNHLDIITDVCVLEYPVGMTVSVDRMGCIYIYQ